MNPQQKAIIDTATGVIKRLTLDDIPQVTSTETAVVIDLGKEIDLGGGYFKLDDKNNKIPATDDEVDKAGVDPSKEATKKQILLDAYNKAINDILNDITVPDTLKQYFTILLKLAGK
jgi:hypothetical protein